ncbi:class I SAM-dependent methyltransferase [Saccharothrix saharensis]|uniref:class I SAM-dependent methyltransferase n=1 Tax=Saccharothrix saharensis TaxID=571190 RepID=UPI0036A09900
MTDRVAGQFPYRGTAFYDDHAVRDYVVDPAGLSALELACGDGRYAREPLPAGARACSGIDGSARTVAAARAAVGADNRAAVRHADLEDREPDPDGAEVDVGVARMVLHYVNDLERVVRQVRVCLAIGGTFTFSVEHPVITSDYAQVDGAPGAATQQVSGHFDERPRNCRWFGAEVAKHHRTVERYLSVLSAAGCTPFGFSEGRPRQDDFDSQERYRAMRDVPFHLIARGTAR